MQLFGKSKPGILLPGALNTGRPVQMFLVRKEHGVPVNGIGSDKFLIFFHAEFKVPAIFEQPDILRSVYSPKYDILPGPEQEQAKNKKNENKGVPDFFHRFFLQALS
jgi:hypothetical protein